MDKIINLIFEAVILLIEENVNELLSKGYLPLGGVSTYVDKDG